MAYKAIVARAHVRPHPNSDNGLKIVTLSGHQVITSADVKDGDLMVFFPEGGVLSPDFLRLNNEYRPNLLLNENQKQLADGLRGLQGSELLPAALENLPGGFFDASGRVRTIKLRGEKSEGYAVTPDKLAYTGYDVNTFFEGQVFDELNGHKICWKYVSPATLNAMKRLEKQGVRVRDHGLHMFHKHFDTENLRYELHAIPDGARVVITEKLHGSSGRTGLVLADMPTPETWWQRLWRRLRGASEPVHQEWKTVTGTRKVVRYLGDQVLRPDLETEDSVVRREIHNNIGPRLHKGETIYYEIVGYWDNGAAIFTHGIPQDNIGDQIYKSFKNKIPEDWGRGFQYAYGNPKGQYQVYVYRITQTNIDGRAVDLSWEQIQSRCHELGLKVVPEIYQGYITKRGEDLYISVITDGEWRTEPLLPVLERLGSRASSLDPRHITEGVCLRFDHPFYQKTLKYKGFSFSHLENIKKNSDEYIDPEEAA